MKKSSHQGHHRLATILLGIAYACLVSCAVSVQSFQLATNAIGHHSLSFTSQTTRSNAATSFRTNSLLFESASAASKWMENEKRLEEEMDREDEASVEEQSTTSATSSSSKINNKDEDEESTTTPSTTGRWEELHGNYILRPPDASQPPRALLHFLGGALLGAAPQLSYRYMLERLSSRGYLIVATPYQLSFDHLTSCDEIIGRFELVAPDLAKRTF